MCDSRRPEAGAGSDPGLEIEDKTSGSDPVARAEQEAYARAIRGTGVADPDVLRALGHIARVLPVAQAVADGAEEDDE
jgi:hypothetical protein